MPKLCLNNILIIDFSLCKVITHQLSLLKEIIGLLCYVKLLNLISDNSANLHGTNATLFTISVKDDIIKIDSLLST